MNIEQFEKLVLEVKSHYSIDIFPEPDIKELCRVDRYAAAGARIACGLILAELMKNLLKQMQPGDYITNTIKDYILNIGGKEHIVTSDIFEEFKKTSKYSVEIHVFHTCYIKEK